MSADDIKQEAVQGDKASSEENVMGPPKEIPPPKKQDIEKEQEAKLRAKYPGLKTAGTNPLLQKRLSKGQQKYFDSGDYNMAKAGIGGKKTNSNWTKAAVAWRRNGKCSPYPRNNSCQKDIIDSHTAAFVMMGWIVFPALLVILPTIHSQHKDHHSFVHVSKTTCIVQSLQREPFS